MYSKINGTNSMSLSTARATSSPSGSRRAVPPGGDSYKHFETSTMDAWDSRGLDDDLALLSLDPQRAQSHSTKQNAQPGRPNPQPKGPTSNAQATQSSTELRSISSKSPLPPSPLLTNSSCNSLTVSASASDSESIVRLERADLKLGGAGAGKSVLFPPPQTSPAAASSATVHSLSSFANLDRLESLTIGQNTFNLNASSVVHMPTAQRLALTVLENHRKLQQRDAQKPSSEQSQSQSTPAHAPADSPAADAAPLGDECAAPAPSHLPGQCVRLMRARPAAVASAVAARAFPSSSYSARPEASLATANGAAGTGSRTPAPVPAAALPFARWQQPTPREASRLEKFEALLFRQRPSGLIDLGTCLPFCLFLLYCSHTVHTVHVQCSTCSLHVRVRDVQ